MRFWTCICGLIALTLITLAPPAFAQRLLDEIVQHQNQLEGLRLQIHGSRQRIFTTPSRFATEQVAAVQMGFAETAVSSIHREFAVLIMVTGLASMITERTFTPKARAFLYEQKRLMMELLVTYINYLERELPKPNDQETSRFLLEARDNLKVSRAIVEKFDPTAL